VFKMQVEAPKKKKKHPTSRPYWGTVSLRKKGNPRANQSIRRDEKQEEVERKLIAWGKVDGKRPRQGTQGGRKKDVGQGDLREEGPSSTHK